MVKRVSKHIRKRKDLKVTCLEDEGQTENKISKSLLDICTMPVEQQGTSSNKQHAYHTKEVLEIITVWVGFTAISTTAVLPDLRIYLLERMVDAGWQR